MRTPIGVKVELVTGSEQREGRVWRLMAAQVYAENGREDYRVLGHLPCGAPILEGESTRISVTHTGHLLAVATLPPTPEVELDTFNMRTALGIDAEAANREQVLRVRERFLQDEEKASIPSDSVEANILAWTAKEAVWKAMLTPGLDLQKGITITRLPVPGGELGEAEVKLEDGDAIRFQLCAFCHEEYILTLAITAKTATYRKS